MMKKIIFPLVFAILLGVHPCLATEKIAVVTSLPAYRTIITAIGEDFVDCHVLLTEGSDPHQFEPTPGQMAQLLRAQFFFHTILPFETRLVEKIADQSDSLLIVNLAEGIAPRDFDTDHEDHAHEDHHHHDHGEQDPHFWLSPLILKAQAQTIHDALLKKLPEHASTLTANLERFNERLDTLHRRNQELLQPHRGKAFLVYHPAFGYFADAYGLEQIAVEIEGKSPSPRQLAALIERARRENIRTIFVQPQFDSASARALAEAIDGRVVSLNPLAEDIFEEIETMAREIAAAEAKR